MCVTKLKLIRVSLKTLLLLPKQRIIDSEKNNLYTNGFCDTIFRINAWHLITLAVMYLQCSA